MILKSGMILKNGMNMQNGMSKVNGMLEVSGTEKEHGMNMENGPHMQSYLSTKNSHGPSHMPGVHMHDAMTCSGQKDGMQSMPPAST